MVEERLEKKVELSSFDSGSSPYSPQNRDAARAHGLRYNRRKRCYVDFDGFIVRDRFGQPL